MISSLSPLFTFVIQMHGSHLLNDEYQISASRLDSSRKSSKSFSHYESDEKIKSSASKRSFRHSLKNMLKVILAMLVVAKGIISSIGHTNRIKLYSGSHKIISYVAPKLLMFKRSSLVAKTDATTSPPPQQRIIEIIPAPLHLIIALSGLDEAKKIMKKDAAAQLITLNPKVPASFNSTLHGKVHLNLNSTTVFESLVFSWCETFKRNKRYPTRLIVTGPESAASCVLGRYRWALKIPKEAISFRPVNSTQIFLNSTECSQDRKDPFDCLAKNREDIRLAYSNMCPDLSPILLACSNRIALERALAYKPRWAQNKKEI